MTNLEMRYVYAVEAGQVEPGFLALEAQIADARLS
jgi:hypothetical protein